MATKFIVFLNEYILKDFDLQKKNYCFLFPFYKNKDIEQLLQYFFFQLFEILIACQTRNYYFSFSDQGRGNN